MGDELDRMVDEYVQDQLFALLDQWDVEGVTQFLESVAPAIDGFDIDHFVESYSPYGHRITALGWLLFRSPGCQFSDTWRWRGDAATPHVQLLRLLVAHGANLQFDMTGTGGTYLHGAKAIGLAECLVKLGASVSARDMHGATPLHHLFLNLAAIKDLLLAGADVNARDNHGRSPLHWFFDTFSDASLGVVPCFEALFDAGADLFMPDLAGRTPLAALFSRGLLNEQVTTSTRLLQDRVVGLLTTKVAFADNLSASIDRSAPADVTLQFPAESVDLTEASDHATSVVYVTKKVHKSVLVASSEKFRAMFGSSMQESASGVVKLSTALTPAFERMCKFMYGREVVMKSFAEIADVARLADEYLVPSLTAHCQRLLCRMLDFSNAVDCLLLSNSIPLPRVQDSARRFIAEHFDFLINPAVIDKLTLAVSPSTGFPLLREIMQERYTVTTHSMNCKRACPFAQPPAGAPPYHMPFRGGPM